MQALISKEGTVKRVHVMVGDSRLRSAAEEAVYKWRYRPYVLNGRPVEVANYCHGKFQPRSSMKRWEAGFCRLHAGRNG